MIPYSGNGILDTHNGWKDFEDAFKRSFKTSENKENTDTEEKKLPKHFTEDSLPLAMGAMLSDSQIGSMREGKKTLVKGLKGKKGSYDACITFIPKMGRRLKAHSIR